MQEAIIKYIDGRKWVLCPRCGRKAFPVCEEAEIKNLTYQCKDSKCKLLYRVNV